MIKRGKSLFGKSRQVIVGLEGEGKEMSLLRGWEATSPYDKVLQQVVLHRPPSVYMSCCDVRIEKPEAKEVKNEQVLII